MTALEKAYSDLEEHGVRVYSRDNPLCKAVTVEVGGVYGVFVNDDNFATDSSLSTRLMHEAGHCATGATHHIWSSADTVGRNERKADRYAIRHFLPLGEIRKAVRSGITEYWQLAEYFGVDERFVRKGIYYWTRCRGERL